jgi:hypothetical protein
MQASTRRLSGIQRQVLSIYRILLKEANKKENSEPLKQYIREQFKQQATAIPVHNHYQIEWYIRHAQSQLEVLSSPQCTNITFMSVSRNNEN